MLESPQKEIRSSIKRVRRDHMNDLATVSIPPQVTVAFMAALNAYSRIRDHAQDIAEAIAGER
jgi:phosphate:Na+ symporter